MNLEDLPQLGSNRLNALAHSDISSLADLINYFPYRYLDRRNVQSIQSLTGRGEQVTVVGTVRQINQTGYGRKKRLEVIVSDGTASMKGVWFKGAAYMKKYFEKGETVAFFGKAKRYGSSITIAHPDTDKLDDSTEIKSLTRISPVYPGNKYFSKTYITSKLIQKWMKIALKHTKPKEFLPASLLKKYNLPERNKAFRMIHFPESHKEHKLALIRFKFEELFLFQLSMVKIKGRIQQYEGPVFDQPGSYTAKFFNEHLPFKLTDAQRRSLSDIKKDVRSGRQMNRLLQGDVGSGKTIVAIGAILMACDNGFQAAFMAPTEILTEQHYRTVSTFLEPLDVNTRLLTGGQNKALRTDILTDIEGGNAQIVVGTHAIIQEHVKFQNLGLAVIDEQHRFGVQQRAEVLQKGDHPHVLVMSATPIPRSLAMTLYSDLDISVMDELPKGRKPVKTAVRTEKKRKDIYNFLEEVMQEGGQAYIVYPLVEESEALDLKDATQGYEKLKRRFSNYEVGLIHGQMKSKEKNEAMSKFINNETQILVSTTIIEVGVDVPNASVMVVEHAERFGLSQLHQLRGRIGRGRRQSYCILMRGKKVSKDAQFRLKKMAETGDGFKIAEADLQLRGPGDFLGTKQSGLPEFKVANIVEDQRILQKAKKEAWKVFEEDATLENHLELKEVFVPYFKKRAKFYGLG